MSVPVSRIILTEAQQRYRSSIDYTFSGLIIRDSTAVFFRHGFRNEQRVIIPGAEPHESCHG